MKEALPLQERKLRPRDFGLRAEPPDIERHRVTIIDGSDRYTFIMRNNKPELSALPYPKRDISDEKWRAMITMAMGIFRNRMPEVFHQQRQREKIEASN